MHSDPEKFSGRWEAASEFKPAPDFHGSGTLSTSSGSSQSEASSTFSSQNGDSPTTSLSSVATSPSLSQDSGKLRRSSELSNADEDLPDPLNGPASKKCRLDDSGARATHADPAPKPGRGCAALRISRALFVENLVDAAVTTIASIWGRFSRESRYQAREAPPSNTLPLDLFVREILRRSRTNCSTLQAALLYCVRCKDAVESRVDRMADAMDALSTPAAPSDAHAQFPSLAASSSCPAAPGCAPGAPAGTPAMSPLLCGRRMFLAAIVVASKFLQDQTYSNRTWSKISGLATREIEQLERIFLHTIHYNLMVDTAQWTRWTQELSSNWSRAKQALLSPLPAAQPKFGSPEPWRPNPDTRLHRANSENVIGQTFPFDAGLLRSDRNRTATAASIRRPSSS